MDVREKLVELLTNSPQLDVLDWTTGWEEAANYLIANGVTVQEWISVKDRLPEDEGWYQVYTAPDKGYKSINKARFCKGFEWDNFTPHWHGAGGTWGNVTHWMPLPQPPKGE